MVQSPMDYKEMFFGYKVADSKPVKQEVHSYSDASP